MTDPYIELYPAMERDATMKLTKGGEQIICLSDCTGASFELYPFEVKLLYDWMVENGPSL